MKQPLTRTQVITLASLFIVIVVLALAFFLGGREERVVPPSSVLKDLEGPAPAVEGEGQNKTVMLFFASEADGLLHPEEREVEVGPTPAQEAGRVLDELVKGSRVGNLAVLPPDTRVRQVYFTRDGIAYVDFSGELSADHPSGSEAELATVFAVVNTLAYNYKDVKRVFILIDGTERESLGGHVRLDRALFPNYSLVAQQP